VVVSPPSSDASFLALTVRELTDDHMLAAVLDAFCGVGGNAIAFAQTCERGKLVSLLSPLLSELHSSSSNSADPVSCVQTVIALDTSPLRLSLARHNALQYGVADRIEFILCDFVSFAKSLSSSSSSFSSSSSRPLNGIDVVFLSPPWGGISYLTQFAPSMPSSANTELLPPAYPLSALQPLHGKELFDLARRISKDVAYYLPKNSDLEEVAALAEERERIEVEEEWMSGKLKALTVLFGDLAGTGDNGNV
jgi:trimethylguanosine synthase